MTITQDPQKDTASLVFTDDIGTLRAELIPQIEKILQQSPLWCVRETLENFNNAAYVVLVREDNALTEWG